MPEWVTRAIVDWIHFYGLGEGSHFLRNASRHYPGWCRPPLKLKTCLGSKDEAGEVFGHHLMPCLGNQAEGSTSTTRVLRVLTCVQVLSSRSRTK